MAERPELQAFSSSVKIDTTAKGQAVITVHVYANDDDEARNRAVKLYLATIEDLQKKVAVATEVKS